MAARQRMLPHEESVQEIRKLMVDLIDTRSISDDMDMYYVGAAGYSPMERADAANAASFKRVAVLAQDLVELGESAAEAVAKGLRMQGRWREHLLPFAREHHGLGPVRAALELVAKRKNDPVAKEVREILLSAEDGQAGVTDD